MLCSPVLNEASNQCVLVVVMVRQGAVNCRYPHNEPVIPSTRNLCDQSGELLMRLFNLVVAILALTWSVAAEAAKYTFDQTGSSVTFHNTASLHGIDGTAKQFSGTFDSDAGTGSLVVQTKSMTTSRLYCMR